MSLGTWRLFLAFLVAISHLWAGMIDGPAAYAVWGFFVLSGYLITLVLTTKYRDGRSDAPSRGPFGSGQSGAGQGGAGQGGADQGRADLWQFAYHRWLRIYPNYIAAVLLGIVTILGVRRLGADPAALNPQFMLPQTGWEWFENVAMIPFVAQRGLPVPVAAALFVEVWAYALMPLLARSKAAAWVGLLAALAANLQYGFGMTSFVARYCGFATGLLPFAVGSVACHYRDRLEGLRRPVASVVAWSAHGLYWLVDPYWPWTYGLWLSVPLSAWVVVSLAQSRSSAADRYAGDLSYPVYLLHTTVAAWLLPSFGAGRSFAFFAAAFTATLVAAALMLWAIDHPVQRLRHGAPMTRQRSLRLARRLRWPPRPQAHWRRIRWR